jgi:pimeloyl-ACP methyl ester carboxylesterase
VTRLATFTVHHRIVNTAVTSSGIGSLQSVVHEHELVLPVDDGDLRGYLARTERDHALVAVARGDAPEHARAALIQVLTEAGISALLVDLLTIEEQSDARVASVRRYDIELLARRLVEATDWLTDELNTEIPVGYFGAGMESAAVLAAAAQRPALVSAVVLCDARPLLVEPALPQVRAPTLLIVPEQDVALVRLNRAAIGRLLCEKRLAVVPGAHRLLQDSSAAPRVAQLARDWFERRFRPATEQKSGAPG